jgi:hypothetical protein
MELYKNQKSMTKDEICESCAFAEFDTPESDYCCGEYVSDCNFNVHSDIIQNIIEEMLNCNNKRNYCPFWLPRFFREFELLRCPSCNSPNWNDISYDDETMTVKLKCTHCNKIRTELIEKIAYSCNPHKI